MNIATMLRGVASLSWLVALAVVAFAILRAARGQRLKAAAGIVIGAVVAALLLTSIGAGLVFIKPEQRGVVVSALATGGYRPDALTPGLHWVIPFAENVVVYPISRQTYTMSIAPLEGQVQGDDSVTARTSDGQEVLIDASVIYAVDPNQVIQVHIDWQDRYAQDLVRPLSRGIIRDEAAQFSVEQIVSTKRFELIDSLREKLAERFRENGILLVDFVLRNITFTPEYAASVEQKQIAEQQAQQAALVVEQKKQEAEQARQVAKGKADANVIAAQGQAQARLIEAKAEAQALQLIADAIRDNPGLITFEYIQKLAPGIQVMLVPSDNPFLLPLPDLQQLPEVPLPTPETGETTP